MVPRRGFCVALTKFRRLPYIYMNDSAMTRPPPPPVTIVTPTPSPRLDLTGFLPGNETRSFSIAHLIWNGAGE